MHFSGWRPVAAIIAISLFAHVSHAGDAAGDAANIKKTLNSRFPEVTVLSVVPEPVSGLYEVFTGESIVYTNAAADFVIAGDLIESRSRRNVSSERISKLTAIDFKTLPLERAIKQVKGDGKRTIAVFSDPDCPYCRDLEKELATLSDVTVYTFLYPIASLHPQAPARARAIWCSKNRGQAWTQWMMERKDTPAASCDGDPVDELQALGQSLRVSVTPTLFLSDGRRIGGFIRAPDLEKLLNAPAQTAGTAAGAKGAP